MPMTVKDNNQKIAVVVYNHNTTKFETIVIVQNTEDDLLMELEDKVDDMVSCALED